LPAWRCFWPVRFDYSYDPNFPDNVTSIVPRNLSTGQQDFDWQAWRYDYYQAGSPPAGSLFHVYRGRSDGTGQVWGQSGGGLGEVWGQSCIPVFRAEARLRDRSFTFTVAGAGLPPIWARHFLES
jgi:hypothetical protein